MELFFLLLHNIFIVSQFRRTQNKEHTIPCIVYPHYFYIDMCNYYTFVRQPFYPSSLQSIHTYFVCAQYTLGTYTYNWLQCVVNSFLFFIWNEVRLVRFRVFLFAHVAIAFGIWHSTCSWNALLTSILRRISTTDNHLTNNKSACPNLNEWHKQNNNKSETNQLHHGQHDNDFRRIFNQFGRLDSVFGSIFISTAAQLISKRTLVLLCVIFKFKYSVLHRWMMRES